MGKLALQVDKLDAVEEAHRGLYEEKDGKFILAVDGLEDTGALKRAKDHEKEQRQAAEKRAKELEDKLAKLGDDEHRKKGDVESLDKSWQEKFGKGIAQKDAEIAQRDQWLREFTVEASAAALAGELAVEGSAPMVTRLIKDRLAMEMRDGKPTTVVLGQDGKPSALTLAELKQEIINDKAFAPLIVGSKASGAGGGKGGGKGGSATTEDPLKWSLEEKSAYISEHGAGAWSKLLANAGKKKSA